jgi:hypothetical protein
MPFLHILVRLAAQFVNSFSVRLQFFRTNLNTGYRKYDWLYTDVSTFTEL